MFFSWPIVLPAFMPPPFHLPPHTPFLLIFFKNLPPQSMTNRLGWTDPGIAWGEISYFYHIYFSLAEDTDTIRRGLRNTYWNFITTCGKSFSVTFRNYQKEMTVTWNSLAEEKTTRRGLDVIWAKKISCNRRRNTMWHWEYLGISHDHRRAGRTRRSVYREGNLIPVNLEACNVYIFMRNRGHITQQDRAWPITSFTA